MLGGKDQIFTWLWSLSSRKPSTSDFTKQLYNLYALFHNKQYVMYIFPLVSFPHIGVKILTTRREFHLPFQIIEWRSLEPLRVTAGGLQAKVETKGKQVCSDWAAEMAWAAWAARDTKNGCLFWWRTAGLGWAGQASLGTSRKYFHCLIPGHRIVIRRYRTLNAFTDKWI